MLLAYGAMFRREREPKDGTWGERGEGLSVYRGCVVEQDNDISITFMALSFLDTWRGLPH